MAELLLVTLFFNIQIQKEPRNNQGALESHFGLWRLVFAALVAFCLPLVSPLMLPASFAMLLILVFDHPKANNTLRRVAGLLFWGFAALFLGALFAFSFQVLSRGLSEIGGNLFDISVAPLSGLLFYYPFLIFIFFAAGDRWKKYIAAAFFLGLIGAAFRTGSQIAEAGSAEVLPFAALLLISSYINEEKRPDNKAKAVWMRMAVGWTMILSVIKFLHYPRAYGEPSGIGALYSAFERSRYLPGEYSGSKIALSIILLGIAGLYLLYRSMKTEDKMNEQNAVFVVTVIMALGAFSHFLIPKFHASSPARQIVLADGREVFQPAETRERMYELPHSQKRYKAVELISALESAIKVKQGETIAILTVKGEGFQKSYPLRTGIETSEWAFDREDVRKVVPHRRARVGASSPDCKGRLFFRAYWYKALFTLPESKEVESVSLTWVKSPQKGKRTKLIVKSIQLIED
ncbi:hypothetical protein ACFLU6_00180 [Acidobacteriota bacterium]